MPIRHVTAVPAAAAIALLLAGCGAAAVPAPTQTTAVTAAAKAGPVAARSPSPSAPSPTAPAPSAVAPKSPSPAATMICSTETRANVATLLALRSRPHPTSAWVRGLFTCTYALPQGRLVLSVQQSSTKAAARHYFRSLQQAARVTTRLTGLSSLGLPAFESPSGVVSFVKDEFTLKVDATRMQPALGPQRTSRSDFAYTVATDILGCWTGS